MSKMDENKLREAYARYGYDWIIEEGWDDAYKSPELNEADVCGGLVSHLKQSLYPPRSRNII